MTTYVLVHGAWYGGWCWEKVAATLRASGHEVYTPTLTGLAERAGEFTPDIGLRTHVDDVVAVLRRADLRDVVLVGHSYAGLVVREAADMVPERVARITLVDAWAGRDGDSVDSLAPEFFRDYIDTTTTDGAMAIPPAAFVGVSDPADAAWLEPRLTLHPRRTFSDPTTLTGAVDAIGCTAVVCTPGTRIPFADMAAGVAAKIVELESGHDAMTIAPDALAEILLAEA